MKWSTTPNRLCNHMYTHLEKKFSCGRCNKKFTFQSNLNLHRNLHRRLDLMNVLQKTAPRVQVATRPHAPYKDTSEGHDQMWFL